MTKFLRHAAWLLLKEFGVSVNSNLTLTGEDDSSVFRFCGSVSTSWRLFFILSRRSPVGLSGDLHNVEIEYSHFYQISLSFLKE